MSGLRARLVRLAARDRQRKPGADTVADRLVDVVELVTWVYRDQRAHVVDGRGTGLFEGERAAAGLAHAIPSHLLSLQAVLQIGTVPDRIGRDGGELHPVAEAVNNIVERMHGGALIVRYARRAEIPEGATFETKLGPDWKAEPRYDLVLDRESQKLVPQPKQGSFRVIADAAREPLWCPVRPDFEPEFLAGLRAEFTEWHDALSELVRRCAQHAARLGGLVVTGPALPREPWLQQGPAA